MGKYLKEFIFEQNDPSRLTSFGVRIANEAGVNIDFLKTE